MSKIMKYKLKLVYTEDELEELKTLSRAYNSPMTAIWRVVGAENCNNLFRKLWRKYRTLDTNKEFDFMSDINNMIMGTSIFSEKKYVVHDKVTDRYIYFNRIEKSFYWSQLKSWIPEIKTKDEWLAINPEYEPMLEKVDD